MIAHETKLVSKSPKQGGDKENQTILYIVYLAPSTETIFYYFIFVYLALMKVSTRKTFLLVVYKYT